MRRSTIVILAGALAFAGFIFYSLATVEPVQVIQSRLERDNGRAFVEGEVRNNDEKIRTIDLEIHYYDHNGRPLGQDTLRLGDLSPGQTRDFHGPQHQAQGVADFSIYLNHGRNPYGN